ncbi:hypothetical protein ABC970_22255 [Bacillus licheniformis]|uniref:hypothetical protein n=1 Tax=Bacillus TaxID=1386 RepID=UPI0002D88618|nr:MULTISPECIES: hypothetical protein [Bacillus]ASK26230.1 hypothetical protein BSSX_p0039 [Bacillus subtilis]MCQ5304564.1 hypothetical protein [Bacillus licheniformis]MDM5287388.1 hypothetical protein [Bacillus licheniformis]MEC0776932.1 hypothetical protein [Bacillus licheniformis]MED1661748.1 hypothetical protein [Bacillus licheniformis]
MNKSYFEIIDPYYSLIKADTIQEAKTIYNEYVSEIEELNESDIYPVPRDYALARFVRSTDENGKLLPIDKVLADFYSPKSDILLFPRELA